MRTLVVFLLAVFTGIAPAATDKRASSSPTIIIWLLPASGATDEDDGEAANDFVFYGEEITAYLKTKHPEIEVGQASGRTVKLKGRTIQIPASAGDLGFYLQRPNKAPNIISGVMTTPDFRCAATDYFGWSKTECPQ